MQNPFTTTFSKSPEYTYISTNKTDEILENFSYAHPSESVYKITGVRGSGKTVILAKIEENLRCEDNNKKGWLVFDLNPTRDMLGQMAAMLHKEGFGKLNNFFDIGVDIEEMLQAAQKKGKKILVGIDEVSKNVEMIKFTSEYGRWLRAGYPVYLVCTGLYENIQEVSNVKNLTFFRRATTIKTEPLNAVRMSEMYKKMLAIDGEEAKKMARLTKGYAYAFQELGVLYFKKDSSETLDDIIPDLRAELFAYSYEKIWEELTDADRFLVGLLVDKSEYKREEVLRLMGDRAGNYSMYRDRLIKRGLLESRQSYISLALPFFADYVKEYCMG
jgi:ABC-type dipeptide/oligopeptide/nickel transport system ATPase component